MRNDNEIAIGYNCFSERSGHTLACGLGYEAGKWNQGARNTAIGHYSVGSNGLSDGADNTGVGYQALKVVTSGNANTAVGKDALVANADGSDNTAVGYYALKSNTSAQRSTAVGYQAVEDSTTADYATGFGAYTLRDLTTGNNNTAVGAFAGDDITTGANNTCIGYQATASSGTVNNEITLEIAVSLPSYSCLQSKRLMEMSILTIQVVEHHFCSGGCGGSASAINDLSDAVTFDSGTGLGLGTGAVMMIP